MGGHRVPHREVTSVGKPQLPLPGETRGMGEYYFFLFLFLFLSFFWLFRATRAAHGNSQARGQITAAGLDHSHSNTRIEPSLQPTPQLKATLDP